MDTGHELEDASVVGKKVEYFVQRQFGAHWGNYTSEPDAATAFERCDKFAKETPEAHYRVISRITTDRVVTRLPIVGKEHIRKATLYARV